MAALSYLKGILLGRAEIHGDFGLGEGAGHSSQLSLAIGIGGGRSSCCLLWEEFTATTGAQPGTASSLLCVSFCS